MLKNYSKIEISHHSTKRYVNDKEQLHRLDGPAVEFKDGSKYCRINGNIHRNIDPADEYSSGEKYWFFENKSHRVGGSYSFYSEFWCINDENYTKQEYYKKVWCI